MKIDLTTKNPREIAYLSLIAAEREEIYLQQTLNTWKETVQPSLQDYALAREIAYGVMRMKLALDYSAAQLTDKKNLNVKLKERIVIRIALYQFLYMEKIPSHAIVNEAVEIAKKYCHETFVKFLNAILRRVEGSPPQLPKGETVPDLSTHFSYPPYFVQELIQNYGLEKAVEIMKAENVPSPTMFRVRPQGEDSLNDHEGLERLTGLTVPVGIIRDSTLVPTVAASSDYYIQNVTPANLIGLLNHPDNQPKRILDLCASPGGKLIEIHDLHPEADLYGNDITPEKLRPISQNLTKYNVPATLTATPGENYQTDEPFDLVILDVPCSNSGVLHKRPEARWRLSQKNQELLEGLQLKLIEHALTLLDNDGEIWYLTCSILKSENTHLIDRACHEFGLQVRIKETVLPNLDGWDGGFGCALRKVT